MPSVLEQRKRVSQIDSKDMLGEVERLPEFMLAQMDSDDSRIEKSGYRRFRNIVFMGMGGSASAGDVTLAWLSNKISVPTTVHRDPSIPKFVGPESLFVALSYSGNTRETLLAFREARKRAAKMICIGTGGKLRELSEEFSFPFVQVRSALAPRAALGQMIVACADALYACGVVQDPKPEIELAARELRHLSVRINASIPPEDNPAKRLASSIKNSIPVVFAFRRLAAVARRFQNQLAENSKMTAKYSLLPEAAHNEIESWHHQLVRLAPIFIRDSLETSLEKSILQSFRSTIVKASGVLPQQVRLTSHSRLGALLLPILYLDYVSVYLALLRGFDPTDTPLIRRYKARL